MSPSKLTVPVPLINAPPLSVRLPAIFISLLLVARSNDPLVNIKLPLISMSPTGRMITDAAPFIVRFLIACAEEVNRLIPEDGFKVTVEVPSYTVDLERSTFPPKLIREELRSRYPQILDEPSISRSPVTMCVPEEKSTLA